MPGIVKLACSGLALLFLLALIVESAARKKSARSVDPAAPAVVDSGTLPAADVAPEPTIGDSLRPQPRDPQVLPILTAQVEPKIPAPVTGHPQVVVLESESRFEQPPESPGASPGASPGHTVGILPVSNRRPNPGRPIPTGSIPTD